jgi:hypothetical protein
MFLGLLYPNLDPQLFVRIRIRLRILPSTSKKINDGNVPTESNKQNKFKKNLFFVAILEITDEKSMIRIRIRKSSVRIPDPDPYHDVPDPEHWNTVLTVLAIWV